MAKLVQTLISLLSTVAFLLALANRAQSQSSTYSFTYDFYGGEQHGLNLRNDAHFPSDSTYLRLTRTDSSGNAQPYSVGQAFRMLSPILFDDGRQTDFETTVKFIITPNDDHPADGLAFVLRSSTSSPPSPSDSTGGGLGIFGRSDDPTNTFAVEFDTYVNSEWDPSDRHVGIDIGSKISRNTTQIGDALIGQEVTARINYVSATHMITVRVSAGSQTFDVSYVYDLGSLLPGFTEIGLSAATGGNVAVHDIISWYFTATTMYNSADKAVESAHIRQIV